MTRNENDAHTATAGDGGLLEQFQQADWSMLPEGHKSLVADAIDVLIALAQAPAVQAPAEEDWQDISTYPKDSFPRLVWREDYGTCVAFIDVTGQWWPVPAFKKLPTPPKLWQPLPASPWATTPTDAQPKAARPVGDETLREAFWSAIKPVRFTAPEQVFEAFDRGILAVAALASHPTTGQETVATPRDGGVRAALEDQGVRSHRAFQEWKRDVGYCSPSLISFQAGFEAAEAAALSAPGSAGPGEAQSALHGRAWVAAEYRVTGSPHEHTASDSLAMARYILSGQPPLGRELKPCPEETEELCSFPNCNCTPQRLATPSPAQEPGTGDTGAKERARNRIQALGAAMSRRDWSAAESAYEAIRDAHDRPDIYDAPLRATPATTAETRGPAEGAR